MKLIILIAILILAVKVVLSAKILFMFDGGNASHKSTIWPLVFALAQRGHKITFVSSHVGQPKPHENITDLAPIALQEFTKQMYHTNRIESRGKYGASESYDRYLGASLKMCQLMLNAPELQDLYKTGAFDLLIINAVFGECGFMMANHFKANYIISSSTVFIPWFYRIYGVPHEASWIPDSMDMTTFPMGLWDRMWNTYYKHGPWSKRTSSFEESMDGLMKEKFGLEGPTFSELERNVSLVFLNGHHSTDFARPLPPMFIPIGGMASWGPPGKLPKEFQDYMDGAEEGVVLITFGSTLDLSNIPLTYRTYFYNMMNKFPKIRFIWRWSAEIPENQPKNLMASKWLPQREILEHPKMKAFVTHCGLSGVTEATAAGVPMIAMPLFADQDFNAYRMVAQEVGISIEPKELTQDILDSAMTEILTNPKYKKNMEIKSKMFKDRPESPTDLAVYWTEFVLRHQDFSAMKTMTMNQSMFTRELFDVFLMALLIFVLMPLVLLKTIVVFVKAVLKNGRK